MTDTQPQPGEFVTIGNGRDVYRVMGPGDCPSRLHLCREQRWHVMAFIDDLQRVTWRPEDG